MTMNTFGRKAVLHSACGAAIATVLAAATPAAADSVASVDADETGASARINYTGKLRTLSQNVVGYACFLQAGVDVDNSRAALEGALAEFDSILYALEFGDPEMGIYGAEERPRTLAGIAKLHENADPIHNDAMAVLNGTATDEQIADMARHSGPLFETAKKMVTQITSQYAQQGEMRQADALTIDLAGRQRTLAQQLSKNVCLISSGIEVETASAELADARENFDSTLRALYSGMPSVGITPPPTSAIGNQLAEVLATWEAVAPTVDSVLAGDTLDMDKKTLIFQAGDVLMNGMNAAVAMYAEESKFDS